MAVKAFRIIGEFCYLIKQKLWQHLSWKFGQRMWSVPMDLRLGHFRKNNFFTYNLGVLKNQRQKMTFYKPSLKNIRLFYIFSFLNSFWPCAPFFVIYFSQITGSFTLAMSLGAIHNFTTTCLEVPTGILSDKFRRKTVTFLGSLSVFIAACLYGHLHHIFLY